MFLRKLAMFFGGRGMVLGLIVLATCVVMLGLMVVMRGSARKTSAMVRTRVHASIGQDHLAG